jgi:hypothetical protein
MFIIRGAGTSKTFTLMLLIRGLLHFYNKHSQLDPSKKNKILMACIGEITFNIHGTTIHSSQIFLNCKHLPSLGSKCLYTLIKKCDQL